MDLDVDSDIDLDIGFDIDRLRYSDCLQQKDQGWSARDPILAPVLPPCPPNPTRALRSLPCPPLVLRPRLAMWFANSGSKKEELGLKTGGATPGASAAAAAASAERRPPAASAERRPPGAKKAKGPANPAPKAAPKAAAVDVPASELATRVSEGLRPGVAKLLLLPAGEGRYRLLEELKQTQQVLWVFDDSEPRMLSCPEPVPCRRDNPGTFERACYTTACEGLGLPNQKDVWEWLGSRCAWGHFVLDSGGGALAQGAPGLWSTAPMVRAAP